MATPSDPGIIPAPSDTVKLRMADGAPVMLRRHGNPSGPRMLFSHGNALAADLYYPFWSSFTDRFDLIYLRCPQSRLESGLGPPNA